MNLDLEHLADRNKLRINIGYGSDEIRFGSIDIKKDSSIVFSSSFINQSDKYKTIDIGFYESDTCKTVENTGDMHVSLHPREQVALFSKGKKDGGRDHFLRKDINWYPVLTPFLFLKIITPPLSECNATKKTAEISLNIDKSHKNSVEFRIYVSPFGNRRPIMYEDEDVFCLGKHKNLYSVSVSCRLIPENKLPAVIWRNESFLSEI